MTDHMLDIPSQLDSWRQRQETRAQQRAAGRAEQRRLETQAAVPVANATLSCDEDGISFGDPQFDTAFATTVGRFVGETQARVLNEMDEALGKRDREIAELRVALAECKGLLQRDRSKDDERRTETIVVEAPNSKMQDLLDRQIHELRAQVAELRGQIAGINTRERGPAGPRGERGLKGPPGRPGRKGDSGMTPRVAMIKRWQIDKQRYLAIPIMSDNSVGPGIELRGLFEQFNEETS